MASLTYSARNELAQGQWTLWRQWTVATALGELVGFAVPALAGALAGALGLTQGIMVIVLVCAGSL